MHLHTIELTYYEAEKLISAVEWGAESMEESGYERAAEARRRLIERIEDQIDTSEDHSLSAQLSKLMKRNGMERSISLEESARSVAFLQD